MNDVLKHGVVHDRSKVLKEARDRKIFNWTPQHTFGDSETVYETDARRAPTKDAAALVKESMAATRDGRSRAKMMKAQLTRTQWSLGDDRGSLEEAKPTSVLPDPTGPGFGDYRGRLNEERGKRIKASTAFPKLGEEGGGVIKGVYETTSQAGLREGVSEGIGGYVENRNRARILKKQLGGTTFTFGEGDGQGGKGDGGSRLTTDYRDGFKFSPELAREARRPVDPALVADLRAAHFELAPKDGRWADQESRGCTTTEASNRKLVRDMKEVKRDIGKEKEINRRMKLRLQRNTFNIGTEEEYMY